MRITAKNVCTRLQFLNKGNDVDKRLQLTLLLIYNTLY